MIAVLLLKRMTRRISPLGTQKNPRAHKNKIGTSPPPPQKPKYPPPNEEFYGHGFSCRKNAIFPRAHKIGAAISGPRIADTNFTDTRIFLTCGKIIDLLMGLFRGAVFRHGGVPENSPFALMGRFPSLMGRFPPLMGRFSECLNGPFSLSKILWRTAHWEKGR